MIEVRRHKKMEFCGFCGRENRSGARFCTYCGQSIDDDALHQELDTTNNQNEILLHTLSATQADGRSEDIPTQTAPLVIEETARLETDAEKPYTGETIPLDKLETLSQDEINVATLDATLNTTLDTAPDASLDDYVSISPAPSTEEEQSTVPKPDQDSLFFELLPSGSVLNGRYRVLSGEWQDDMILYQVEDLHRCWNCQVVQAEPDAVFCEACGAELIQKPHLQLRASRPLIEPANSDDRDRSSQGSFTENGIVYQVESQPVQAAPISPPSAPLTLSAGYRTDSGKQRDNNEDSLLVLQIAALGDLTPSPVLGFFAVADGVGGYAAGEVASHAVVRSLTESILGQVFIPEIVERSVDQPLSDDYLAEQLRLAVLAANQAIIQARQSSSQGSTSTNETQMESTLTAALVRQTCAVIANVGDSRTYLMRQGRLSPVTKDHSVVARLVERGVIQPAEIYTHEQRNIILRSLGEDEELEVDIYLQELQPGDRLLLCSDGLWEMVHDPFIEDVLLERFDPQQACDKLLDLANMAGGEDNISVIVVNLQ
jgi:serine/threonine protein phosphatase PrpC